MSVGLLLCDDLLFASRIIGTAQSLGLTVHSARSAAALQERARQEPPVCVIVDLDNPGLDIANLTGRLREVCSPIPRVVAYGSHVDAAGLKRARDAGCDLVLPRSRFVEELPRALPQWLSGPSA